MLAALAALSLSVPALADDPVKHDWVRLPLPAFIQKDPIASRAFTYYVDRLNVERGSDGSTITVWTREDFMMRWAGVKNTDSMYINKVKYDCRAGKSKTMHTLLFSNLLPSGPIELIGDSPIMSDDWTNGADKFAVTACLLIGVEFPPT
jgi:hypothetical protein